MWATPATLSPPLFALYTGTTRPFVPRQDDALLPWQLRNCSVCESCCNRKYRAKFVRVTAKSQLTNSNCALRDAVHIDQGVIYFQYVIPVGATRPNSTLLTPTSKVRPSLNTVLVEVTTAAQHSGTCTFDTCNRIAHEVGSKRLDKTDGCSEKQRGSLIHRVSHKSRF
jgi:hypothetical protein